MAAQPTEDQVVEKVRMAIERLNRFDILLFEADVNERSIAHKLATYLQDEFQGWDVDCEYNRDHVKQKRLKLPKNSSLDGQPDNVRATRVFPDIIVHHRGTEDNLLVIEIKKTSNQKSDVQKLEAFKRQLGYTYTLFLRFNTGDDGIGVKEAKLIL